MRKILSALALALALIGLGASPALACTGARTFTFTSPQTDVTNKVNGTVSFTKGANGTLNAKVKVTGLDPNSSWVTVPYKDPYCTPTPGVTAFPSAQFFTDANGSANVTVSVNPKAINPLGSLKKREINSASFRKVIVQGGTPIPGGPIIPNVPNIATPAACSTNYARTQAAA